MQEIVVSDTSCLILLNKIGRISLLETLFKSVTVTATIAKEFGKSLPDFITIENPKDVNYQKILERFLDPGEASAIALALENEDCLLIMDETKGRKEANRLKLAFTVFLRYFSQFYFFLAAGFFGVAFFPEDF